MKPIDLLKHVKNQYEQVVAIPLAGTYKQERIAALKQWRKANPGKEDHESGLENTTPFEYPAFLAAIQSIAHRIGPDVEHLHLISDKISANIPTWVFAIWQERVRQQNQAPEQVISNHEKITYLRGKDSLLQKRGQLRELRSMLAIDGHTQAVLFVTDNIDTGATLESFIAAATEEQLPFKIAVLSHYELPSKYDFLKGLVPDSDIYYGESLPRTLMPSGAVSAGQTVIGRHRLTGDEMKAEFRKPLLEALVKKQAADFAGRLPLPE